MKKENGKFVWNIIYIINYIEYKFDEYLNEKKITKQKKIKIFKGPNDPLVLPHFKDEFGHWAIVFTILGLCIFGCVYD